MLKLLAVDLKTLPFSLLDNVKAHLRVEFARDDDYIAECTARAISEIQAATDLTCFASSWEWTPDETDSYVCRYGVKVPFTPVRKISIKDQFGVWVEYTDVVHQEFSIYVADKKNLYLIEAGYETASQVPPLVLNAILLLTGTLYENRESIQLGTVNELPDMARRLLSGLWRPSV